MLKRGLVVLLCIFSTNVFGQTDTLPEATIRKWYFPDGMLIEYAGGFGMFSGGILYYPGIKTEVALTVGYTPEAYGNMRSVNLFGSYSLIQYDISEMVEFQVLNAGVFLNYNIGDNIYLKWPEIYPKTYYWWNSALRFGPFFDTGICFSPPKHKMRYNIFFQCNTNDLYFAIYRHSQEAVKFNDILVFGAGIKITGKR